MRTDLRRRYDREGQHDAVRILLADPAKFTGLTPVSKTIRAMRTFGDGTIEKVNMTRSGYSSRILCSAWALDYSSNYFSISRCAHSSETFSYQDI